MSCRLCRKTNEWAAMMTFKIMLLTLEVKSFEDVLGESPGSVLMFGRNIAMGKNAYIDATIIEIYHAFYNIELRNVVRGILCLSPFELANITWEKMKDKLKQTKYKNTDAEEMVSLLDTINDVSMEHMPLQRTESLCEWTGCRIRSSRVQINSTVSDKWIILAALLQISM